MHSVLLCHVITLVVILVLCDKSSAQIHCAQFDFNRTSDPEFHECPGNYPIFIIKDYTTHRDIIKPYRLTSHYFLSNNFESFSCIESSMHFVFDTKTTIEAAIYLKSFGNSFIEITVYDADRNERIQTLRSDGTTGWFILQSKIHQIVHNAQVMHIFNCLTSKFSVVVHIYWNDLNFQIEIIAFISTQSVLAIEYIHILNSAIKTPECGFVPPPVVPPPTTTHPPITITNKPSGSNNATNIWWWVIFATCAGFILIVAIMIGIYCIVKTCNSRSQA